MLALRFAIILVITFYPNISHSQICCSTSSVQSPSVSQCSDSSTTCNVDTSVKTIKCSANCTIVCTGTTECSAYGWIIQCTDDSVCNVICNGQYACQFATINATNARTLLVTEEASYWTLWNTNILCPHNGECNIKCYDTAQHTTIEATNAKSLFISLLSNNNSLFETTMTINCPSHYEIVDVPELLSCGDTQLSYLCSGSYRWKLKTSNLYDITYSTCDSSINTRIYVYNESDNLISNNSCANGNNCAQQTCDLHGGTFNMFIQPAAIYYVDIAPFYSEQIHGKYRLKILCNAHTVHPSASLTPTFPPTNLPTSNPTFVPSHQETTLPTNHPSFVPTLSIPTTDPTHQPSNPSFAPTFLPSQIPSPIPTYHPTFFPSQIPSLISSPIPTSQIPTTEPVQSLPTLYTSSSPTMNEGPNTSFTTITTNNTSSDTHDKESKSSINILALVISLIGLGIILCIAVAIREKWQDKKWEKELSTKIWTEIQLGNTTIMYYTNNESISHQQQYIPPPINTGSVTPGIELVNITPFTTNDDAHSDDDSESQHEGSDHGSNILLESIQTQGNDALPQKYEQKQETKNGEEEFLLNDIAKPLYHEKQKWELCLLHALNSLLQREEFTQKSLNNICKMLAPNKMINPHKALFGTGNYDANVLMMALNNINIQVQWFDARKANQIDLNNPLFLEPNDSIEFIGFILNNPQKAVFGIWSRRHWLSIKRINGKFYNLDSKLSAPKIYDNVDNLRRFLVNALTANNAELMICRKKKQNK
eukprot:446147_1